MPDPDFMSLAEFLTSNQADRDLIAACHAFLSAAEETPDVEISIRNGLTAYAQMLGDAPDLVRALLARITELERERAEARRMHDESPGECYHCPRCQDADETERDVLRARITELEQQAKNGERFDALMNFLSWRCQATTTRAAFLTPDDHRAIWCTLPNGHAGWHHGEIEDQAPTGVEGFTKAHTSQVHWTDGQPGVNRG